MSIPFGKRFAVSIWVELLDAGDCKPEMFEQSKDFKFGMLSYFHCFGATSEVTAKEGETLANVDQKGKLK